MGRMSGDVKNSIASILRKLGIDWVRQFEERDPQFIVITKLCSALRDVNTVLKLTILNSLVSYQLTGKGEDHWEYFVNYFISNKPRDLCSDFLDYVVGSKYLARFRESRVKRVRGVCPKIVNWDLANYVKDLLGLWRAITRIVGGSGEEKTIVFSVKMAYYVYRACGFSVAVPMEIPIPVDYRVSLVTICSGLLQMGPLTNPSKLAREVMVRRRREIQGVWSEVGRLSGIPPLNLDSVVWVLGGLLIDSSFRISDAVAGLRGLGVGVDESVIELLHLLGGRCIAK